MADDVDLASEREERYRAEALAARREEGPKATGFCLHCGDPAEDGRRWCAGNCRDRWERNAAKAKTGSR